MQETAASYANDRINERIPKIGMNFLSDEEAYSFYNKYAEVMGFSVRRGGKHRVKDW